MAASIKISAPLLSSVIDEANECCEGRIHRGLIFGSRKTRRIEEHCDSQENRVLAESSIAVTSYLNFREMHPLWSKDADDIKIQIPPAADRGDVVGLLVIRRDGNTVPSIRDIGTTRHYLSEMNKECSDTFPFLILIISLDRNSNDSKRPSWIYGMNFTCFGVYRDSPL
jgi:hypothetical protein